ncbi:hypothetical protein DSO57_1029090 [Entomophthora muscae]|uniref:Uncharacterized protein n=1 Tax=Entomophthora muscae TaxID=34485 RepID=A0ACC2RG10_9FUNG|nr:hypothetical protein DSO57_1029090 [Entomophthora muscae]
MPVQCNFISGVAPVDTDHSIFFIKAFSLAISTEIPDFELSRYYIEVLSTLAHVLFSEATLKLLPLFEVTAD